MIKPHQSVRCPCCGALFTATDSEALGALGKCIAQQDEAPPGCLEFGEVKTESGEKTE